VPVNLSAGTRLAAPGRFPFAHVEKKPGVVPGCRNAHY